MPPRKNKTATNTISTMQSVGKSAGKSAGKGPARTVAISYIPLEEARKTVDEQFEGLRPLGNLLKEKFGD